MTVAEEVQMIPVLKPNKKIGLKTHISRTRQITFDIPKRNVRPSPCRQPPADRKRHVLKEKIASGSIYLNPRSTIRSSEPNHLEQGFKIGSKMAQTIAPHINDIQI